MLAPLRLDVVSPKSIPRRGVSYTAALLVGLALVLTYFPRWALVGLLPTGGPPRPDFAQHVIGQLYYLAQPWPGLGHLLSDAKLNPPTGTSIALTDSIPLLTMLLKLLGLAAPGHQAITLYQAAAWTLQPVAAVFALRSAGERRLLPAIAISVMAASMPTYLYRFWHAALSSHFWLLLMLGLSIRITTSRTRWPLVFACAIQVSLLLIHPYLMLMATGILAAAPLTQWARRDRRCWSTSAAIVASSGIMLLLGEGLGYWGSQSDGGFGYFSMNLVSPVWPTFSSLFPGIPYLAASAVDGQAEGYQYLGAGFIALLVVSLLGWRQWIGVIRNHLGICLACVLFTGLAVTNWVYFMHTQIIHVPFPSARLEQLRGSGRLFWVTTYSLLVASFVVVLRRFPLVGAPLLLAASLLQFADMQYLRQSHRDDLSLTKSYPFDAQRLEAILQAHDRLTVLPTFSCNGGGLPVTMDLLWVAAKQQMTINSMYAARQAVTQDCLPVSVMSTPPEVDEVRVILPGFEQALVDMAGASDCRRLQPFVVCTRRTDLLAGLPEVTFPAIPPAIKLDIRPGSPGEKALLAGWTVASPSGGAWSTEQGVYLGAAIPAAETAAIRIRVRAVAMPARAPPRWRRWRRRPPQPRVVTVWAGDEKLATWVVGFTPAEYEAIIPAAWVRTKGAAVIELRTGPLVSLLDLGVALDPRRFGILIDQIGFNPQSSQPSKS